MSKRSFARRLAALGLATASLVVAFLLLGGFLLCFLLVGGCAADRNSREWGVNGPYHTVTIGPPPPAAPARRARFSITSGAPESLCGNSVCWTSSSNPTARQLDAVAEQRELAAQLRLTAPALVAAEAIGCGGLDPEDRDISPFYHREDVVSVSQVTERARTGKGTLLRTSGARVKFRAVPGLSSQWLQREVDCHLLRAAAVDYSMPKMSYCPLMLEGIEVRVAAAGTGFAVEIRSEDASTTDEILRRAYALLESVDPWASIVVP